MNADEKRTHERNVMTTMIALYCRGHDHTPRTAAARNEPALCPACRALLDYACSRIEHCPRMEVKTFCSACPVHCYSRDMRAQIRAVMGWCGPRMLLHHPVMTLRHMWIDYQAHRREKKGTPA